jgi:hypothetical protein
MQVKSSILDVQNKAVVNIKEQDTVYYTRHEKFGTQQAGTALMHYTHIQEGLSLNLSWDTGYPEVFCCLPWSLQANTGIVSQLQRRNARGGGKIMFDLCDFTLFDIILE